MAADHNARRNRNLKNAAIAFLVPLPSIFFYLSFLHHYSNSSADAENSLSPMWKWCLHHPLLLANALFFLNVNCLFWVISQIQSSHWMIDPFWTVIPVMLVHYYATHPLANYNLWRSRIVIVMTWIWSIRLSHNYFRRENWQWGAREDWRFNDMGRHYGKMWSWLSFFSVYVSQQVFLIGICMPFYAIHTVEKPLNTWDFVAVGVCLCGVNTAYFADKQLHEFVTRNHELKERGEPVVLTLNEGLWRYSRHPNYFGEQLWWWGLVIFAWNLGEGWTFVGCLINSLAMVYVTKLVEERMLGQESRAEAYRHYQKTTSAWIPWIKSPTEVEGKEKSS